MTAMIGLAAADMEHDADQAVARGLHAMYLLAAGYMFLCHYIFYCTHQIYEWHLFVVPQSIYMFQGTPFFPNTGNLGLLQCCITRAQSIMTMA